MQEITKANKKFFLKWLPFNFCDRHCERCEEMKNDCKLYLEDVQFKMQCLRESKDPNDAHVVFEHIGKLLSQTMAMLETDLKKRGVKLTKEDKLEYDRESEKRDKIIHNHSLHKRCRSLSVIIHKFLSEFHPAIPAEMWAVNYLKKEIENISFYSPMIMVKAARALFSQYEVLDEGLKFSRPDHLVSATLGYYSLITVEKSLKNIKDFISGSEPIWDLKINGILREIGETKRVFIKTFPQIIKFRNKIIFHGD